MKKKRILLTGASGMVGRNFLEHPDVSNYEILFPTSSELDLTSWTAVEGYLRNNNIELIVHAAGKVGGIQANIQEPVSFLMKNLDMGRNIVWGAYLAGVKQLINLGSSCMYPRNQADPLREELVLQGGLEPTNEGYALAKIVIARLCEYIGRENPKYQYKTLIPCNIYGRHDKFDPANSHLLPAIIHKIHLAKESCQDEVEVWGDGTARREFMYAGDFADAIIHAIDNYHKLPANMNIGLGEDHAISEYYQAVSDVIGYKGGFVYDTSKPVGMSRKLVNIEKQIESGWVARSDLHQGIKKTYEYYLKEYF